MKSDRKSSNQVIFLRGKRVNLRPLRRSTDLESYLRWLNDPETRQYISVYLPMTETAEGNWLDTAHERQPNDIVLGICLKNGKLIGGIGLHRISSRDGTATTGTMIGDEKNRGRGYGTDAKMTLLEYAFNTLNLRKICSAVIASNEPSIKYGERCGYKEEGRRKKQHYRNGQYWDEVMLAVFKEDWLPLWKRYNQRRKHGKT